MTNQLTWCSAPPVVVTRARAERFAAATNADVPTDVAPALFGVAPLRHAFVLALGSAIPADVAERVPVLHGEHLVRSLRPIVINEQLVPRAQHIATEIKASGTTITLLAQLLDDRGALVEEHELTSFVPRHEVGTAFGTRTPLPTLDDSEVAPEHVRAATDPEQSRRYAAASGDASPFHVDDDAARKFGYTGVIMHGLCTLAVSVNALAGRLDARLRTVACRFSAPAHPGEDIDLTCWQPSATTIFFEARSPSGDLTISRGSIQSV